MLGFSARSSLKTAASEPDGDRTSSVSLVKPLRTGCPSRIVLSAPPGVVRLQILVHYFEKGADAYRGEFGRKGVAEMRDGILRYLLTSNGGERPRINVWLHLAFLLFVSAASPLSSFAEVIASQAAVVMDASTGEILYGKNSTEFLPPASTAKLMTAIVVMEKANLTDIVTISQRASQAHRVKAGFRKGDRVTIEGLLYAALVKSANDAAVALAEAAAGSEECFVSLMNQKAASIGAVNTKFVNATGLPGGDQHITAIDLSIMMKCVMNHPRLKEILSTPAAEVLTEKGKAILLRNTDKLLWSDEEIIAGKTGYTYTAKHCFVFAAERNKKTIIVSLLGSPSRKNLWKEAKELTEKGFQMIARD